MGQSTPEPISSPSRDVPVPCGGAAAGIQVKAAVHLLSSGPDGESHTDDDITVGRLVSPTAVLARVPEA
ncbi:MAG TPA: hypothetical protein VNB06_12310 [Thermoanaerobaculia bacterium]|nr:hypothetical protein [Thermoanaerobaculia bacterium]